MKPKSIQQKTSTSQKLKLRKIITGATILVMTAVAIIYLNFSNSQTSKADNNKGNFVMTYRSTEINVPVRMLRDAASQQRTANKNYKSDPNVKHEEVSRASDIVVINAQ